MKFNNQEINFGENYVINALVVDLKVRHTPNDDEYYVITLSDGIVNVEGRIWSKKLAENVKINEIYLFKVKVNDFNSKPQFVVNSVEVTPLSKEEQQLLIKKAPLSIEDMKEEFKQNIASINNQILKEVVIETIKTVEEDFFTYPAAVSMHHNYVSGLAYHTISMARLAKTLIENYKGINADLLMAGVLLHDVGKVKEIKKEENGTFTAYTLDGSMLGHIVIGLEMVENISTKLNYRDTEEVKMLLHLIASHHGELEFGSPKTPLTMEAWALHLVDLTDSKLAGMEKEVVASEKGNYTNNNIPSINKKLYIPNIK